MREIQTKLEEAEEAMKKLQDESMSDHREIQRGQKLIDNSEITRSRKIEKLESRAEELETELSKAKDSTSDYDLGWIQQKRLVICDTSSHRRRPPQIRFRRTTSIHESPNFVWRRGHE